MSSIQMGLSRGVGRVLRTMLICEASWFCRWVISTCAVCISMLILWYWRWDGWPFRCGGGHCNIPLEKIQGFLIISSLLSLLTTWKHHSPFFPNIALILSWILSMLSNFLFTSNMFGSRLCKGLVLGWWTLPELGLDSKEVFYVLSWSIVNFDSAHLLLGLKVSP